MEQLIFRPRVYKFDTCKQFLEQFPLTSDDLILTNAYIFKPYFGSGLPVNTIFLEEYGTGEPTDEMVEHILEAAAQMGPCRRIIALGGGAVIDTAKAMAAASAGEHLDALYDAMPNLVKLRELVIIPTTCGTGSEMTNIAVINRTRLGTKMGLVGDALYADQAVLIPELLQSLPFPVFTTSSIDALVHAVESCLSPAATPYTKLFGYRAIEMIVRGYQVIGRDGRDRWTGLLEEFLLASNYAGIAFGTAGCGTVHAMAYPLGGRYHVAHGESNYAVFLGVMKKYMALRTGGELAVMNRFLADLLKCTPEDVYKELEKTLEAVLPRKSLRKYGVQEAELPEFAESVMENQQRLLKNSFVPMTASLILEVYRSLY